MMLIFGLMLLQTAACLDQFCRFDQTDPCYTALGHKLNLMLDDSVNDLKIIKRIYYTAEDPVCRVKNGTMKKSECGLYNNRPEVTVINGALIINRVIRSDSGNYTLTLSRSDGSETSRDLQVIVEAAIGSVNVSIICFSNHTVFCSADGDQISYNWILNGEIIGRGLMFGNSSIDLDERTDGNISCSVKNHVSHQQKTIRVKPCPEPTTAAVTSAVTSSVTSAVTSAVTNSTLTSLFSSAGTNQTHTQSSNHQPSSGEFQMMLFTIGLGCAGLILILLFITLCYVFKKKQLKSTKATAGDTELIYTDISCEKKSEKKTESLPAADEEYATVRPKTKRKKRKEEEDEVQYGEVTFTPSGPVAPQQPQEECVYAQVQRS